MQLSTIRYFYKVSRSRSIREAAEQLHISASAVSRKIAELEHEFGHALVERHPRGIRLTEAGEIVQQYFKEILLDLDAVHEHLNELKGMLRGRVRIASVEGAVAYLVMGAIESFRRDFPGMSFDVTVVSASDASEAVLRDDADIMIAYNVPENADISVVASSVSPLCAVVAPSHALGAASSVSLRDVAEMHGGYLTDSHGTRMLLDGAMHKLGVTPRRALVSNSIESLKAFVRHGSGVTLLPPFVVWREVNAGELVLVPIREVELVTGSIIIGVRRRKKISRGTQELAARLKDILLQLPAKKRSRNPSPVASKATRQIRATR